VVITVAFIGYLVAGPLGAILAAIGVFSPLFLRHLPGALLSADRQEPPDQSVRQWVTAAATGAIAGAAFVLGRRAIVDLPTVLIALMTFIVLSKIKKSRAVVILGAGFVGCLLGG